MKKILFLASLAAVAMTSCTSESNEYVGNGNPQAQTGEIAFRPLAQPTTRTAVNDAGFNANTKYQSDNFDMVAYLASADGATPNDYFSSTLFEREAATGLWKGNTPRYWPMANAKINFLAVTQQGGGVDKVSSNTFANTNYASQVVTVFTGNNVYDQADLLYAAGQGVVTKSGNKINYPTVNLVFQHALSWINFTAKTKEDYSANVIFKVNSITLNNAVYGGTYTVDNSANYNTTSTAVDWSTVIGTWGSLDAAVDFTVPAMAPTPAAPAGVLTLSNSAQSYGAGLLVVPDGKADGFTVNYSITQDGIEHTYDYIYTFSDGEKNWAQRKKYTYAIEFTLTEIKVTPTVQAWDDTTPVINVDVPIKSFAYVSTPTAGALTLPTSTAGTYTVEITGLPSDCYKAQAGSGTGTFITVDSPSSYTTSAVTELKVTFTVTSATGKDQTIEIYNDEVTPVKLFDLTVTQP